MVYVVALLIFLALSAAGWAVSADFYQYTFKAPDPTAGHETTPGVAILLTALTCFIPFPGGYLAAVVMWAVAAFAGLGLPAGRAVVLWLYLAASSFVAHLVVLGVMGFVGK